MVGILHWLWRLHTHCVSWLSGARSCEVPRGGLGTRESIHVRSLSLCTLFRLLRLLGRGFGGLESTRRLIFSWARKRKLRGLDP